MSEKVFMAKSGELCVATPCSFIGNESHELANLEGYSLGIMQLDGYAIYHPEMASGMTLFFNREIENLMEDLGVL